MIYIVTDRNDKDRPDPIIDTFATRKAAEQFAAEWSADNDGTSCAVEEWAEEDDATAFPSTDRR